MGISVSFLKATDEEIRAFESRPKELDQRVTSIFGSVSLNRGYMAQFWGKVSVLIQEASGDKGRVLMGLCYGELKYKGTSDKTWAIFSETVKAVAEACEEASRAVPDPASARRYVEFRHGIDQHYEELMIYFTRFCGLVAEAAREGVGLIGAEYEDW
jgi:hypothetical protein